MGSMDGMTSSPCQKSMNVQFELGQEIVDENSNSDQNITPPKQQPDRIQSDSVGSSNSTTSTHSNSSDSADSGISSGSNSSSPDTSPNNNTVQPKSVNSCQSRTNTQFGVSQFGGNRGNSRNLLAGMGFVPGMNMGALGLRSEMTMHSSLVLQRASNNVNSKTQSNITQISHCQIQCRSTNSLSLFSHSQLSYQGINCKVNSRNAQNNKMSEIIKGKLYVGSLENLNDLQDFEKYYITRVVTAMNDFPESMLNIPSIQKCKQDNKTNCISSNSNPENQNHNHNGHLIIPVKDRGHENIDKYFDQVNAFIDGNQTGATYIHCHSGISRSVTLCMAYLLAKQMKKTVSEAISFVQEMRPKSCPNFGFLGQLTSYAKNKEISPDVGFSEDVEM